MQPSVKSFEMNRVKETKAFEHDDSWPRKENRPMIRRWYFNTTDKRNGRKANCCPEIKKSLEDESKSLFVGL